jgi:hypothetical protein
VAIYLPSLSTATPVTGALWQNMLASALPEAGLHSATTPFACPVCDTAFVGLCVNTLQGPCPVA